MLIIEKETTTIKREKTFFSIVWELMICSHHCMLKKYIIIFDEESNMYKFFHFNK